MNLYGFVGNDPVNYWDYLGLSEERCEVAILLGMRTWYLKRVECLQRMLVPAMGLVLTRAGLQTKWMRIINVEGK